MFRAMRYDGEASRGACPSTADTKGIGEYPLSSTFNVQRTGGLAARPGSCHIIAGRGQNLRKWDVEPVVGLAARLRALGAEVRVCAPDFAERPARVGVPLVHGSRCRLAADVPRRAAELIAARFEMVAAAAEGCDALVATGVWL
jgi:hypothetical protein